MRKSDVILIVTIIILNTLFLISVLDLQPSDNAIIYYDNVVVREIDLNEDNVYSLNATNGEVEVTVKDGKVAITKETSPLNICSKQGYVDVNKIPLICLPNKVVVEGVDPNVDGVAR